MHLTCRKLVFEGGWVYNWHIYQKEIIWRHRQSVLHHSYCTEEYIGVVFHFFFSTIAYDLSVTRTVIHLQIFPAWFIVNKHHLRAALVLETSCIKFIKVTWKFLGLLSLLKFSSSYACLGCYTRSVSRYGFKYLSVWYSPAGYVKFRYAPLG